MTRRALEHIIRASGAIAEVDRLVIVGSQAILGSYPDAPPELLRSMEADVYPPDRTELAGRTKDHDFVHSMVTYNLVTIEAIRAVADELPGPVRDRLLTQIRSL